MCSARGADVDVRAVGGEGDAVGGEDGVVDYGYGARLGVEAVGCCGELGENVGYVEEVAVLGVGEPDCAGEVDGEVIRAVEVVAEVVIEDGCGFVGVRV